MRTLKIFSLALLAIASCSTPKTITVWKSGRELVPPNYKILVVGVINAKNDSIRRAVEETAVKTLSANQNDLQYRCYWENILFDLVTLEPWSVMQTNPTTEGQIDVTQSTEALLHKMKKVKILAKHQAPLLKPFWQLQEYNIRY